MPASAQPIRQKRHGAARLAGLLHAGVVWVLLGRGRRDVCGGDSGAIIFSVCGCNKGGRCRRWSIRRSFTEKLRAAMLGGRRKGVEQLCSNFADLPDKDAAWEDLIQLTGDEDIDVRWRAADALGSTFQHVSDKDAVWECVYLLTGCKHSNVRRGAANALGSAFQHVPDKDAAWEDLHRLTGDEDSVVRWDIADALGSAFQYIPDKTQAWKDLILLTKDEDSNVRVSANHSLGRASIFKATVAESEDDFESKLKNAIEFFEASSKEDTYYDNPSRFCLPF